MSMCRRFGGDAVVRLTVSVPADLVDRVDRSIHGSHPARGCRSEFVRLALAEKLNRDLMLSAHQKRGNPDALAPNGDSEHAPGPLPPPYRPRAPGRGR